MEHRVASAGNAAPIMNLLIMFVQEHRVRWLELSPSRIDLSLLFKCEPFGMALTYYMPRELPYDDTLQKFEQS